MLTSGANGASYCIEYHPTGNSLHSFSRATVHFHLTPSTVLTHDTNRCASSPKRSVLWGHSLRQPCLGQATVALLDRPQQGKPTSRHPLGTQPLPGQEPSSSRGLTTISAAATAGLSRLAWAPRPARPNAHADAAASPMEGAS